jgi:hypothetical protein
MTQAQIEQYITQLFALCQQLEDSKVDVVPGKQLTTNDYSTPEKQKLSDLPYNAELLNILDTFVVKLPGKQLSQENFTKALLLKLSTMLSKGEIIELINLVNSSLAWRPSVRTYEDMVSSYPTPQIGWTVETRDTGIIWRWACPFRENTNPPEYDFSQGQWVQLFKSATGLFGDYDLIEVLTYDEGLYYFGVQNLDASDIPLGILDGTAESFSPSDIPRLNIDAWIAGYGWQQGSVGSLNVDSNVSWTLEILPYNPLSPPSPLPTWNPSNPLWLAGSSSSGTGIATIDFITLIANQTDSHREAWIRITETIPTDPPLTPGGPNQYKTRQVMVVQFKENASPSDNQFMLNDGSGFILTNSGLNIIPNNTP